MITNRKDLKLYLECDRKALGIRRSFPRPFTDYVWKWERLLRFTEFYKYKYYNTSKLFFIIPYYCCKCRLAKFSVVLGFSIPTNVFGPGLSIAHPGTIVVSDGAVIGRNCRIHEGVTIGATNSEERAAIIGDNVFIGTGAKIIGQVRIADYVSIAANAVVVHDVICDSGCTVGGIPAKVISSNDSRLNLHIID